MDIEDRCARANLIVVYKILHGLSAVNFSSLFEFPRDNRTRSHPLKLKKSRNRFETEFFSERVVNWWNRLDKDTVYATTLNWFKHHLQKLHKDESFHRLFDRRG